MFPQNDKPQKHVVDQHVACQNSSALFATGRRARVAEPHYFVAVEFFVSLTVYNRVLLFSLPAPKVNEKVVARLY